jgi:ribosomal protein L34E
MQRAARPWTQCDNLNHLRPNAPIRHCPQCGRMVNGERGAGACDAAVHANRRKQQSAYCIDCGFELIAKPPGVR